MFLSDGSNAVEGFRRLGAAATAMVEENRVALTRTEVVAMNAARAFDRLLLRLRG